MKTSALFVLVASLSVACGGAGSSSQDEPSAPSSDALTGSIQTARGCAIRDAYTKAAVADLKTVAFADLSPALKAGVASRGDTTSYTAPYGDLASHASISQLEVPGVGSLLVLESSELVADTAGPFTNIDFFDARGEIALYGIKAGSEPLSFDLGAVTLTNDPVTHKITQGYAITPLVCE